VHTYFVVLLLNENKEPLRENLLVETPFCTSRWLAAASELIALIWNVVDEKGCYCQCEMTFCHDLDCDGEWSRKKSSPDEADVVDR
jgi:hypothetical protein